MTKIIKDPIELSTEEVKQFADALGGNDYQIITSKPTPDNVPQKLSETLRDVNKIRMIMEDPGAEQCYFSIQYRNADGSSVVVPIGVYGVSPKRKARFPLVINGIWITLVSLGKEAFSKGLNLEEEEECSYYFAKFLEWKKGFIRKTFTYYYNSDYCSAMSWDARGKGSNTRIIAEEVGFNVIEFDQTAIFSKTNLAKDASMLAYYKNCLFRWKMLSRNDPNQPPHINKNTVQLVRDVVGLTQDALL
jgi:hypothetical protein